MTYILQNFTKLTLAAFLFTASLPAYCQAAQEYDEIVDFIPDGVIAFRSDTIRDSKECSKEGAKAMILKGSTDGDSVWLKMTCRRLPLDEYEHEYEHEYKVICNKKPDDVYSEFCKAQSKEFSNEAIKERLDNVILAPSK